MSKLGLQRGIVILKPYSRGWANEYAKEAKRLRQALENKIIRIEHIGSTAIPGSLAKPILDIAIEVKDIMTVESSVPELERAGYHDRGDGGVPGRRTFAKGPESKRTVYLHVSEAAEFERQVLFREYMRAHPEEVVRYNALKKDLSKKFGDNRERYTSSKDSFIKKVMELAKGSRPD